MKVAVGDRFKQADPPPGYQPTTITIVRVDGAWAWWEDWRRRPPRPIQVRSLSNHRLWRSVDALGEEPSDG